MSILIVIPARWASTRFPGKPLAMLAGRSLLERTIDLARRASDGATDVEIVIATDDQRIVDAAEQFGCESVLTDAAIGSGSGRALAAARLRSSPPRYVINLQGDAPLIPLSAIAAIVSAMAGGVVADCVTPVIQLDWQRLDGLRKHKQVAPFSGTTCTRDGSGRALWFSKAIIPMIRGEEALRRSCPLSPVFQHLGVYGYAIDALERFEALPPSPYEDCEGLEQLRMLEAGMMVLTVEVDPGETFSGGIDTPQDLRLAERLIALGGELASP